MLSPPKNHYITGHRKNQRIMARTKSDYEEWKRVTLNIYKDKEHLIDAVWNQIYSDAERDGYADHLEGDEDDMIDIIGIMIAEAK